MRQIEILTGEQKNGATCGTSINSIGAGLLFPESPTGSHFVGGLLRSISKPSGGKMAPRSESAAWENDFRVMCRTAISVFNSGQPLEIQVGEPGDIVNFTAVPERESRSVCFLAAAPEAPARSAIPSLRDEDGGFRDLVEESQQGILIHRNWRPVFGNQALARIFGFSDVDEILKLKSVRELYAMHEHERLKLFNEAWFARNAAPEI